ncbi:MAG: late competence development ComFB family protein [Candidatus Omnitrophota bacterium]
MEYRNYMEELAMEILEGILKDKKEFCGCQRCRLDTIALTLNNLPAKYCVTDIGWAHTKLKAAELQFRADVVRRIDQAC